MLKTTGQTYHKSLPVLAKKAVGGEKIVTETADGVETANEAGATDFIVKNQTEAGETYVVPADKFRDKYRYTGPGPEGFDEYQPLGSIVAVELSPTLLHNLQLPQVFSFDTPWDNNMVAKEGDFLACPPDFSEIYRIARKEFFETYSAST